MTRLAWLDTLHAHVNLPRAWDGPALAFALVPAAAVASAQVHSRGRPTPRRSHRRLRRVEGLQAGSCMLPEQKLNHAARPTAGGRSPPTIVGCVGQAASLAEARSMRPATEVRHSPAMAMPPAIQRRIN